MTDSLVALQVEQGLAHIRLNRSTQRNALNLAMFDVLDEALERVRADRHVVAMLLTGAGPVFCAGFDLNEAVENEGRMAQYIQRLSSTIRTLRRLDAVVVAAVQGSAIAGGCALLTGCDFVFVGAHATLGYPVHQFGVSPAVTMPTLMQTISAGQARSLLLGGAVVDGKQARAMGLASHVVEDDADVIGAAREFSKMISSKGPLAMRTTKQWLNALDGSLDDAPFDAVAQGSAGLCDQEETHAMLAAYWQSRSG